MHFCLVFSYLGNRTVTLVFSPFSKGEVLSVFFFCFSVAGSASFVFFAVLLFYGSMFVGINFRERTFVFGCRGWSCVFRGVCLGFCYRFWHFAPETVRKNSRSSVFGFVLSFLGFP